MLCKPLNPMVLLIIIPMKNGYFIGNINPTFSGPNPSKSYTLTDVAIPANATNILVLLEGTGGEATIGVRSSGSRA